MLKLKHRHRKRWGQPCITHKSSSTDFESEEDVDELENQGESMKNGIFFSILNGRRLSLQQPIDAVTQIVEKSKFLNEFRLITTFHGGNPILIH